MTRRFYIVTEITAEVSESLTQDEIRHHIHDYLDKDKRKLSYSFYVQKEDRLSVTDEKGENI